MMNYCCISLLTLRRYTARKLWLSLTNGEYHTVFFHQGQKFLKKVLIS